jgi:hypothetical protein
MEQKQLAIFFLLNNGDVILLVCVQFYGAKVACKYLSDLKLMPFFL